MGGATRPLTSPSPRKAASFAFASCTPRGSPVGNATFIGALMDSMDSISILGVGLGFRLLVDFVGRQNLRVSGMLIGLWEGIVLYHSLNKAPRTRLNTDAFLPYVGYSLRLLVDLVFTQSIQRMAMVLLWTAVGMVLGDIMAPIPWLSSTHTLSLSSDFFESLFVTKPSRVARFHERKSRPSAAVMSSRNRAIPRTPARPRGSTRHLAGWSEPDTETETVLPVAPPHSHTPSPDQLPEQSTGAPQMVDPSIELPSESIAEQVEINLTAMPEIPTEEELYKATGGFDADSEHTPTNNPEELPNETYFIQEPELSPIDIFGVDAEPMEADPREALPSPPPIPVPAFTFDLVPSAEPVEDIEGTGNNAEDNASVADTVPESIVSGIGGRNEIIQRADSWRQQADTEDKGIAQLKEEQRRAEREGHLDVAFVKRIEVQNAEERVKFLHAKAERRYFHAHNLAPAPDCIDVHRLKVGEAQRRTEDAFQKVLLRGGTELRVIVGRGKHSAGKLPVLKLAIMRVMQGHKIPVQIDPTNPGVLILSRPT